MLERLRFSIPMSITINAPAELVWDVMTDLSSYPSTLSSILTVIPIEDRSSLYLSSANSGSGTGTASRASNSNSKSQSGENDSSSNIKAQAQPQTQTPLSATSVAAAAAESQRREIFMGSKWRITRISLLEHQRYSAKVTITQYDTEEDGKRSFTMSTHQLLGAAASFKMIVQPLSNQDSRQHGLGRQHPPKSSSPSSSPQTTSKNNDSINTQSSSAASAGTKESCQVTAIVSMIPYQFFVKLVGIMCCSCLLKYRARMAMECDMEDLANVCERMAVEREEQKKQVEQQKNSTIRIQQQGNNRMNDDVEGRRSNREERISRIKVESHHHEDEADAAGGSCSPASIESHDGNNLMTIIEEDCSGC